MVPWVALIANVALFQTVSDNIKLYYWKVEKKLRIFKIFFRQTLAFGGNAAKNLSQLR